MVQHYLTQLKIFKKCNNNSLTTRYLKLIIIIIIKNLSHLTFSLFPLTVLRTKTERFKNVNINHILMFLIFLYVKFYLLSRCEFFLEKK